MLQRLQKVASAWPPPQTLFRDRDLVYDFRLKTRLRGAVSGALAKAPSWIIIWLFLEKLLSCSLLASVCVCGKCACHLKPTRDLSVLVSQKSSSWLLYTDWCWMALSWDSFFTLRLCGVFSVSSSLLVKHYWSSSAQRRSSIIKFNY